MKTNMSMGDLTAREIWGLVKDFFVGVIVCTVMFVIPYLLFTAGGSAIECVAGGSVRWWIGVVIGIVVLFIIVSELSDICGQLSRLFADLENWTRVMSTVKKVILVILFVGNIIAWKWFPAVCFFVYVLVFIPWGLTYDKYKRLLREKTYTKDS